MKLRNDGEGIGRRRDAARGLRAAWKRLNQARRLFRQQKKIFALIKPTAVSPRWRFIFASTRQWSGQCGPNLCSISLQSCHFFPPFFPSFFSLSSWNPRLCFILFNHPLFLLYTFFSYKRFYFRCNGCYWWNSRFSITKLLFFKAFCSFVALIAFIKFAYVYKRILSFFAVHVRVYYSKPEWKYFLNSEVWTFFFFGHR